MSDETQWPEHAKQNTHTYTQSIGRLSASVDFPIAGAVRTSIQIVLNCQAVTMTIVVFDRSRSSPGEAQVTMGRQFLGIESLDNSLELGGP